jgi:hypothetical protein
MTPQEDAFLNHPHAYEPIVIQSDVMHRRSRIRMNYTILWCIIVACIQLVLWILPPMIHAIHVWSRP